MDNLLVLLLICVTAGVLLQVATRRERRKRVGCQRRDDEDLAQRGMDNWPDHVPHPPPGFKYPNGDVS